MNQQVLKSGSIIYKRIVKQAACKSTVNNVSIKFENNQESFIFNSFRGINKVSSSPNAFFSVNIPVKTNNSLKSAFIVPMISGIFVGLLGVYIAHMDDVEILHERKSIQISYNDYADNIKIASLDISRSVPASFSPVKLPLVNNVLLNKNTQDGVVEVSYDDNYYNADKSDFMNDLVISKISSSDGQLVDQVFKIIRKFTRNQKEGLRLAARIVTESKKNNYDPLFVAAVVKSESGFNALATSSVGAKGLMQIMPATGKYLEKIKNFGPRPEGFLTDPQYNLKLGINYLKYLEDMYNGNKVLTLIAYNWGPGKVNQTVNGKTKGVPKDVMNYALKILHDHNNWKNEMILEGTV